MTEQDGLCEVCGLTKATEFFGLTHDCMVSDCKETAKWEIFDGNFWIDVCQKDRDEFKQFAQDNSLHYEERHLSPISDNSASKEDKKTGV